MLDQREEVISRDELRIQAATDIGVPVESIPRHIAIIMDGNGRWALQRELPRPAGHQAGAKAVHRTITRCRQLGIEVLTLYSFSHENWKRSADEVGALMSLAVEHLIGERDELCTNQIRLVQIGRRDPLPDAVLAALDATIEATRECDGMTLALALNYGSRTEIADAARRIAEDVASGVLTPDMVDEDLFEQRLYTAGLPDPDMVIRTAGECRLSNFLLWQASYAELVVSDVLWPEFDESHLEVAIREYAGRERRYGSAPLRA